MIFRSSSLFCLGDKANLEQQDKIAPAFDKPKISKDNKQKSVRIECRCKGKAEPKVTWRKEKIDVKDTPNKYKISKNKEADDTYLFILDILVSLLLIILQCIERQLLSVVECSSKRFWSIQNCGKE
jgi:hypothetical protein